MKRLTVFVKGNVDVHGTLVYSRVNGRFEWNGLNEVVRDSHPDHLVRVRHEVSARWDRTGIEGDALPADLVERRLPLGAHSLESQFRSELLGQPYDALVLSIQADVFNPMFRHRRDGYLLLGNGWRSWGEADRAWMSTTFEHVGRATPAESMSRLRNLIAKVRAGSSATVLVFNLSSVVPGETIGSHLGLEDALSTRIRAFNLALAELSQELDFLVVDVDRIFASAGADRLKLDVVHYARDGYRLIAVEVLRLLEEAGHFDAGRPSC